MADEVEDGAVGVEATATPVPAEDAAPAVEVQPAVEETPAPVGQASTNTPSAAIPLRFQAPSDTDNISLSTGRIVAVVDGIASAPSDLTLEERNSLFQAGFTLIS